MVYKKGRERTEMRKIEKQSSLNVTFSKRRAGLFKKANELAVLCGSEVAVLVFSPAGKVFSFGHPDADSVIDRFLTVSSDIDQLSESPPSSSSSEKDIVVKVEELSRQLRELDSLIEEEKKKQMILNQIKSNHCTMINLDELELDELMGYQKTLMEMKNQLAMIANDFFPIHDDLMLNDDVNFDQLGSVDLMTCAKILMSD